ncbi:MAG: aminotransferase class III-fold pyridoxal phosphate-dependent enzyme, partial [Methyloligellaceae bacterium]
MTNIIDLDRRHVWHPYTQHQTERDPVEVTHGDGAVLFDAEGQKIVDMISSWWTCIHGHAHPEINRALSEQASRVAHVMFSGFTHRPGVELAAKLAEVLPGDLNKVFFSDDGSTAVEVALKMAYQYWANQGDLQRKTFLAFDGGYHGDTFGSMAVGKASGFFTLFEDLMCSVISTPYVGTWLDDKEIEDRENWALGELETLLTDNDGQIAGIIMEPLMQGASGMNFSRPRFVNRVAELARKANT